MGQEKITLILSLNFNPSDSLQAHSFARALLSNSPPIFHASGPSSQFRCLHLLSPHPLTTAFPLSPNAHELLSLLTASLYRQGSSLLQYSCSAVTVLSLQCSHGSPNPKPSCSACTSLFHLYTYYFHLFILSTFPVKSNFQDYFSVAPVIAFWY